MVSFMFQFMVLSIEGRAVAGGDDEGDGIYWPSVGGCCYDFIGYQFSIDYIFSLSRNDTQYMCLVDCS